ncbi:VIT1/CCC1 transporter family protein [Candidatus Woesearchaeota archaeon]|nr:VIT1/CCC1 transporter family protein [Candidatus Woesearchaeota archaeon]
MITRNLEKARDAYLKRDVKASIQAHKGGNVEAHRRGGVFLKNAVYGGLDGIITTFAVVAGVAGASLSSGIVLILGFANLIADGLSMAIGDYLSSKSEQEFQGAERAREEWEVDNYPEGERKELAELYQSKGLGKADASKIAALLSKNRKVWVDVMMAEELGIVESYASPSKGAIITFFSFAGFGIIPLVSFIFLPVFRGNPFLVASLLTAASLFFLGALRVRFTSRNWFVSGFEMLAVGGIAAFAAYAIGFFVSSLV